MSEFWKVFQTARQWLTVATYDNPPPPDDDVMHALRGLSTGGVASIDTNPVSCILRVVPSPTDAFSSRPTRSPRRRD